MYNHIYKYSMGDYGILKLSGNPLWCGAVYCFTSLIWEFPDDWEYDLYFDDGWINQPQWHGKAFNYYWNEYVEKQ